MFAVAGMVVELCENERGIGKCQKIVIFLGCWGGMWRYFSIIVLIIISSINQNVIIHFEIDVGPPVLSPSQFDKREGKSKNCWERKLNGTLIARRRDSLSRLFIY